MTSAGNHGTIKVAQWATGAVGTLALAGSIDAPDLDLVAVYVSSEAKEGRDAADLAGRPGSAGVHAAAPGILAAKDLPLVVGRGTVSGGARSALRGRPGPT